MKGSLNKKRCAATNFGKTTFTVSLLVLLLAACGGGSEEKEDIKGGIAGEAVSKSDESQGDLLKPDELSEAMLNGANDKIYDRFSASFKNQISRADFTEMASAFTKGVESFEQSSVLYLNGSEQRVWESQSAEKGIVAIFDEEATIHGLQIMGLTAWPETDNRQTNTDYDIPLRGDWLVFWGGKNVLLNYHYEHESQRYAYDFVQEKEKYSYKGDPLKNESYYAFGQEVVAPADGVVVSVVNDIQDNDPVGVMNEKQPAGNVIVIDHGGEYSILAHLKKGSTVVKPGEKVMKGDVIGQVGNSGNSSEAHLHFQVSDGPDLFSSHSININWSNNLNPIKGETINALK